MENEYAVLFEVLVRGEGYKLLSEYKNAITKKKEYCEWKGIDLLVIDEQDWYDNRKGTERDINKFICKGV